MKARLKAPLEVKRAINYVRRAVLRHQPVNANHLEILRWIEAFWSHSRAKFTDYLPDGLEDIYLEARKNLEELGMADCPFEFFGLENLLLSDHKYSWIDYPPRYYIHFLLFSYRDEAERFWSKFLLLKEQLVELERLARWEEWSIGRFRWNRFSGELMDNKRRVLLVFTPWMNYSTPEGLERAIALAWRKISEKLLEGGNSFEPMRF